MWKSELVMLVGLPGSGKSYLAKQMKKDRGNCYVFSSDEIRAELNGSEDSQEKNEEVFTILHSRIKQCLKKHQDNPTTVIYDACNINWKRRRSFLREIDKYDCDKTCVIVYASYKQCLENNRKRAENGGRFVPEHVIERMYKNFFIPYYYEGWDHILIEKHDYGEEKPKLEELFYGENGLCEIPHNNHHHTLSIGNHCIACYLNLVDKIGKHLSLELGTAALLHDIGKRFTKSYKNYKGETTEEAHYYQHHSVSAYDAINYLDDFASFQKLKTVMYIQWHMYPFFWEIERNEKMQQKYRELWGEIIYKDVMLLHEADRLAH